MSLTSEQNATLKAAIIADPALNAQPNNSDGAIAIANALNLYPVVDFLVWGTVVPTQTIINAIDGSKYTPSDAADGTATYTNRILACQTKQISLQTLVQGRESIDASKSSIRAWLRDSVIQCPAGAAGALIAPGGASGVDALNACTRKATRVEQILSTGSATTGNTTANLLGFEGAISYQDVETARNS